MLKCIFMLLCVGDLASWRTASLLVNNIWTTGCTCSPELSTLSLGVIIEPAEIPRYCCPNHHRYSSMFHGLNQAFRIIGFLVRSVWRREQEEGRLISPYHVFPIARRPYFMIITLSFSPFSVAYSNQRFSNCSCTVDVGFVKFLSNCFRGNGVFKMGNEFCCHLRCSSSLCNERKLIIIGKNDQTCNSQQQLWSTDFSTFLQTNLLI